MFEDSLFKGADGKLFHFARANRKSQTEAEKFLWSFLRQRKLQGFKFRRQHPISYFIVDFYCPERNLVIELDGDYHKERDQRKYDEGRTFELQEFNLKVIRFTNVEVLSKPEFVLNEIVKQLSTDTSKRTPKQNERNSDIRQDC
jgi:very-short-patch-repair endonuclease